MRVHRVVGYEIGQCYVNDSFLPVHSRIADVELLALFDLLTLPLVVDFA